MNEKKLLPGIGIGLIALSLVLFGLGFFPDWSRRTDPAVTFLCLAAAFIFVYSASPKEWHWKGWFFVPISAFLAFGIIFLFNAITNDWSAWAYAWILCIAGLGIGVALAARSTGQIRLVYDIGVWVAAGSAVLFSIFGAIAGGSFIRSFSIVLLGLIGLGITLGTRRKDLLGGEWFPWPFRAGKPGSDEIETRSMQVPVSVPDSAPQAAEMPQNEAMSQETLLVEPLSKRELEVLRWIDQGLTNSEIANRMVVANSTVKTHINNIYAKLDVQTRTQAVRRARDLGLL